MAKEKMVALGREPIIGSPLQQWVNEGLRAKYGPSFPIAGDKKNAASSTQSSPQKHSSSRSNH
jgi:hypothetical protein